MKKCISFILFLSIFTQSYAIDSEKYKLYEMNGEKFQYTTPTPFQFATTLPSNGLQFLKSSFSFTHDNLVGWGAIILSSALLIHYDQQVTDGVQKFGRKIGIGNAENTKPTLKIGGAYLLRRPSDLGSAMYFIGDGWITLGFTGAFMGTGLITHDERTLTVGHELLQGIFLTGITTQLLKRSTGRESPIKSTAPGGVWRFFPKTSQFQGNISKYDAFPSGHLATTMTTFMILSENYKEYTWIKPVGYTLMSLLSFQMVNNSVHWAGDYPLALGIGYMIGKTIVESGRRKVESDKDKNDLTFLPYYSIDGKLGINASMSF